MLGHGLGTVELGGIGWICLARIIGGNRSEAALVAIKEGKLMSRAGGYVRFPDGTIKAFMYNGTTDTVWPALFDTSDEAWDAYGNTKGQDLNEWHRIFEPAPVGAEEDVEVYSDYGNGFWWRATATRNRILTRLDWDEFYYDGDWHDGAPEWIKETAS